VAVAREETTACTARELRCQLTLTARPVSDLGDLLRQLEPHRCEGHRIVFTSGCFDNLHRGHITYLGQAKGLGSVLVVGINSDESIRRLKGPTRPINALDDRMELLAALSCVDYVVPFEADTPCDLVRAVRPDILVKGGDYTIDRLPEASVAQEYGGEVRILPFVADRSTTALIERIRSAHPNTPCGPVRFCAAAAAEMVGLSVREGADV
jgi:D-beta-D-heptose 7-phosphate kinase/D-beta-D-heptose 1-phosphate adenosyltransferase